MTSAFAQTPDQAASELLRQQQRDRVLRESLEVAPDVRLLPASRAAAARLPRDESPCQRISQILLDGDEASRFIWALTRADPVDDPATGRCLGAAGIDIVMTRVQDAIVARGFVTTRVLAAPQDLTKGRLTLTVVPGRVRAVRFTAGTSLKATASNAVPIRRGDLLNVRDIEQALENFKRVPTVEADIQIVPAEGMDALPGESDLIIAWRQRAPPFRLALSLDDSGGRATGKLQGGLTLSLDDLFMWNDLFYLNTSRDLFNQHGRGTRGSTLHYSLPLGYWTLGTTLGSYTYRQTVAGHRQQYRYSGESDNSEIRLSRLVYRDAVRKVALYWRGWARTSNNFIDDTEIEVQRRRTAGWELGATHREFFGDATVDASVAYRRGTGALRSLAAPEDIFGEGTSRMRVITADLQSSVPVSVGPRRWRYLASLRAQWNRTPLVPNDRFSIGGRYSVRGFDGDLTLMGDRGWVWRNELGISLWDSLELYAGADYGRVGGPSTQSLQGRRLAGGFLGLRGGAHGFFWDLFVARPLSKPQGFSAKALTTGFNLNWSY